MDNGQLHRVYSEYLQNRDAAAIGRRAVGFSVVMICCGCISYLYGSDLLAELGILNSLLLLGALGMSAYGCGFSLWRLYKRYRSGVQLAKLPLTAEQRAALLLGITPSSKTVPMQPVAQPTIPVQFAPARQLSDTSSLAATTTASPVGRGRVRAGSGTTPARQSTALGQSDVLDARELDLIGGSHDHIVQSAAVLDTASRSMMRSAMQDSGPLGLSGTASQLSLQHSRAKYLAHFEQQIEGSMADARRQQPGQLQYMTSAPSTSKQMIVDWAQWLATCGLPKQHPVFAYQAPHALEEPAAEFRKAVAKYFATKWLARLKDNTSALQDKLNPATGALLYTAEFLERRQRNTPSTSAQKTNTFGMPLSSWTSGQAGNAGRHAASAFILRRGGPARTTLDAAMADATATRAADIQAKEAYEDRKRQASTNAAAAAPAPVNPGAIGLGWGAQPAAAAPVVEAEPAPRVTKEVADLWEARFQLDAFLWPGHGSDTGHSPTQSGASAPLVRLSSGELVDVRAYVLCRLEDLTGSRLVDVKPVKGKASNVEPSAISKLYGQEDPLSSYLGDETALSLPAGASGELPSDSEIVLHFWATMMDEEAAAAGARQGSAEFQVKSTGGLTSAGSPQPRTTHRLFSSRFIRRTAMAGGPAGVDPAVSFAATVWASTGGSRLHASIPHAGSVHGGEEDVSRRFAIWIPPDSRSGTRALRPHLLVDGVAVDLSASLPAREHVPAACALFSLMQLWEPVQIGNASSGSAGLPLVARGHGHGVLCIERGVAIDVSEALARLVGNAAGKYRTGVSDKAPAPAASQQSGMDRGPFGAANSRPWLGQSAGGSGWGMPGRGPAGTGAFLF